MELHELQLGLSLISLVFPFVSRCEELARVSECHCNGTNYCLMGDLSNPNKSRLFCYYSPYPASKNAADHVLYPSQVLHAQRLACGIPPLKRRRVMPKIIGGQRALLYSWPWMAGLYLQPRGYNGKGNIPLCGASLISPRHLITAAHCVLLYNSTTILSTPNNYWFSPLSFLKAEYFVRLGNHYLEKDKTGFQKDMLVDRILIYGSGWNILVHDIAILKLKEPVMFWPNIQPICIPPPNIELAAGTSCIAVGWGRTEMLVNPVTLMEAKIPLVSTSECRIHSKLVKEGYHVCAGEADKKVWTGDSGGGLYCKLRQDDKQWYLYGVTSFGIPLGGPGVFSYVPRYTEWIHRHVLD
ncbi:Chymotrypsin-like protease CTRL-1 [Taenia crassiceps]|uniref:Chymotrypsin-like protease CTRL-1 n=1 Tax=Taenia crassiceps TaxID=6207 RepID=A0ABR4QB97_9CEST